MGAVADPLVACQEATGGSRLRVGPCRLLAGRQWPHLSVTAILQSVQGSQGQETGKPTTVILGLPTNRSSIGVRLYVPG
jgi:hypothetical protein